MYRRNLLLHLHSVRPKPAAPASSYCKDIGWKISASPVDEIGLPANNTARGLRVSVDPQSIRILKFVVGSFGIDPYDGGGGGSQVIEPRRRRPLIFARVQKAHKELPDCVASHPTWQYFQIHRRENVWVHVP